MINDILMEAASAGRPAVSDRRFWSRTSCGSVSVLPPLFWSGLVSSPLTEGLPLISSMSHSVCIPLSSPSLVSVLCFLPFLSTLQQIANQSYRFTSLRIAASHFPRPGRIDACACEWFSVFLSSSPSLQCCESETINERNWVCWRLEEAAGASNAWRGKLSRPEAQNSACKSVRQKPAQAFIQSHS